jgi:hypothetical protein
MSKQKNAKKEQGYEAKPVFPMCSNCAHFQSDFITDKGYFGEFTMEKNLRCGIGGFAVKKQGSCQQHKKKGEV